MKCSPEMEGFDFRPGMVLRPLAIGAHAFVVLAVAPKSHQVLVVAWTSLDDECPDDECLLLPEDHPEISRSSALAFSRARLWDANKLKEALATGLFRKAEPFDGAVWQRVISAARQAANLRREWKKLLPAD